MTDEGSDGRKRQQKKQESAFDSIPGGFLAANKNNAMLISPVFKYDRNTALELSPNQFELRDRTYRTHTHLGRWSFGPSEAQAC